MISKGAVDTPQLSPGVNQDLTDTKNSAAAAQATADAAAAAAETAQSTADGKNKIFYQTSAPTAVSTGDLWFDTDNGYSLSQWNGSSWAAFGLGNAAIANLDAGKITAGIINSIEIRGGTPVAGVYPFRVTTAGALTSTSGSVGGWQIDANGLLSPNGNIYLYNDDTSATITCGSDVNNQISIEDTGRVVGAYTGIYGVNYFTLNNPDDAYNIKLTSSYSNARAKLGHAIIAMDDSVSSDFTSMTNNQLYVSAVAGNITVSSNARTMDLQRAYAANGQFINFLNKTTSTTVGRIQFNGTANVDYLTSSDARLKENLVEIVDAVEIIKKLRPVEYNFISDSDDKFHGFIAQEMHEVYEYPVAIGGDDPKEDPWSIDYGKITPLLTAGVKELVSRIEQLEAEIEFLKNGQ